MDKLQSGAGVVVGVVGPIVVAGLLVGVRDSMQNANVALVLVVVVVLAAAVGGRAAGTCAAVSSTLAFDFFHTVPYLRLSIASANDVETTLALLAVGLIVGELAARVRRARRKAEESGSDIRRIHRLAEGASQGEEVSRLVLVAQEELTELLHLRSCRFEAPPFLIALPRLNRAGSLDMRVWRLIDTDFELPETVELPVYGRGEQLGRFVLDTTPGVGVSLERRVVAVAIADQIGAALAAQWNRLRPPS